MTNPQDNQGPVDHKTWRTFDLDEVKRFAWDICREVAEKGSYNDPWVFQDFLMASKLKAYKSHDKTTVDSFFNDNNIYMPLLEQVIEEVVTWGFFSKTNDATEIQDAVYVPTQKIKDYAHILKHFQSGELGKIEEYKI
jgi:hypothetical protein